MKKSFAFLSFCLMSLHAAATPISLDQLSKYQEAVNLALNAHPLNCVVTPSTDALQDTLQNEISEMTSGDLNSSGTQPILTFSYSLGDSKTGLLNISFAVTTSADLKSIVSIQMNQSSTTCTTSTQDVNLGNLENPNIVSQSVTTCSDPVVASAICQ